VLYNKYILNIPIRKINANIQLQSIVCLIKKEIDYELGSFISIRLQIYVEAESRTQI